MYLIERAIVDQVDNLQTLLGARATSAQGQDAATSKMSSLHYAALYNKVEAVKTLLDHNAGK